MKHLKVHAQADHEALGCKFPPRDTTVAPCDAVSATWTNNAQQILMPLQLSVVQLSSLSRKAQ